MTNDSKESIWTRPFALLCLAEFLGYAQHFILQPTFPLYITQLGGSPFHVGLVIASFGVASVMSRPLLGYWADRWSVTGVMILGLFLQTLSISLCFVPFIAALMFANGSALIVALVLTIVLVPPHGALGGSIDGW